MIIKNKQQRKTVKEACYISTKILKKLYDAVKIGVTGLEIDKLAFQLCKEWEVRPSFYGVPGKKSAYQHAVCVQLNEQVVHGLPTQRPFRSGDLITIDFGIIYEGYHTDHAFTVGLGKVKKQDKKLLEVGRQAVLAAVNLAVANNSVGDLGSAMISTAQENGFDTIKEYVGHGIGKTLHEAPELPAFGTKGQGLRLKKGMLLCIECQVIAGEDRVVDEADGWTVSSKDRSKSVMFEYMVEVGKTSPKILTDTTGWELVKSN